MEPFKPPNINPTWRLVGKLKEAPRTHLLMCNILFDKIRTGSNLMKKILIISSYIAPPLRHIGIPSFLTILALNYGKDTRFWMPGAHGVKVKMENLEICLF